MMLRQPKDIERRVRTLEAHLRPREPIIFSPWQRVLSGGEISLLGTLAARGACAGGDPGDVSSWRDDFAAWRALRQTPSEEALLLDIERVAREVGPELGPLWSFIHDLRL